MTPREYKYHRLRKMFPKGIDFKLEENTSLDDVRFFFDSHFRTLEELHTHKIQIKYIDPQSDDVMAQRYNAARHGHSAMHIELQSTHNMWCRLGDAGVYTNTVAPEFPERLKKHINLLKIETDKMQNMLGIPKEKH